MQPMIVDLPAPFGPSRPKIAAGGALNVTWSTATSSPYCLRSCTTSIIGANSASRHPVPNG
jgi:hypothetical protein